MKDNFNQEAGGQLSFPQNVLVPSVRDRDGTGYDIFSLLLKERIIVVQGGVESTMASVIISQIKYLESVPDSEGRMNQPITMLINSPGGSVIDGLAIYDAMRNSPCKIQTLGSGMQASMGSILLAGGDTRMMTKNSQVMVHQIMSGAPGGTQQSDLEISVAHSADLYEKLKSVYVSFIGLNHAFWDAVGERNTWLTAEQAVKLGYVHGIVDEPAHKKAPYAAEAVRQNDNSLSAKFRKLALEEIASMSAAQVQSALNNGSAENSAWGRYRPELVLRLAEFPQFWTKQLAVEKKAQAKLSASANDNGSVKEEKAPGKKRGNTGPTAG